jgi:hypothetical protein
MNFKLLIIAFIFTSLNCAAGSFKKGDGSQFALMSEGQKVDLNIYVSESRFTNLAIEMHFGVGSIFVSNMWQQFHFQIIDKGPVAIKSGYIKTSKENPAEIMTKEFFQQNEGVQIQDFLFSKKEQIEKLFIGDELVEIPAGNIMEKHYRRISGGQTVDFWISDKVLPIGLVKLVSVSKEVKKNNYSIELASLLKNVKPTIIPSESIKLTDKTAELLRNIKK